MSRSDLGDRRSVLAFAISAKLCALGLLYVAFLRVPVDPDYGAFLYLPRDNADPSARQSRLEEIESSFVERLAPLDGQYYLDIAAHGYRKFEPTQAQHL
jgi:hypothetical protein